MFETHKHAYFKMIFVRDPIANIALMVLLLASAKLPVFCTSYSYFFATS